jgi:hypothetical protein
VGGGWSMTEELVTKLGEFKQLTNTGGGILLSVA